jgi:hypothetical protein
LLPSSAPENAHFCVPWASGGSTLDAGDIPGDILADSEPPTNPSRLFLNQCDPEDFTELLDLHMDYWKGGHYDDNGVHLPAVGEVKEGSGDGGHSREEEWSQ